MGRASYRAVIVPPLLTIRKSTLRLLQTFKAVGGLVVFAGEPPQHVDARPSIAAADTARICVKAPAKGKALADAVEAACRRVSILDENGDEIGPVLHLLQEDDDAFYLFVCNTGYDFARGKRGSRVDVPVRERDAAFPNARVLLYAPCKGAPIELDPQTGETCAAAAEKTPQGWMIQAPLAPLASRIFVIPKDAAAAKLPSRPVFAHSHAEELDPDEWEIALSECNNLVLDRPVCRIGSAKPRGPEEVLRVDVAVREALGIPPRGGRMVQPWARKPNPNPKSIPVSLTYAFDVKTLPTGDLALAVERPDLYRIAVNGFPLDIDAQNGWWTDLSLRRIPFDPALLRLGANTITLDCDYREDHPGLEIIYLLGAFGVAVRDTDATLIPQPQTLKLGDWVRQGLPFYSGSVTYLKTFRRKLSRKERLFVEIPDYRGVAARILVNGRDAGVIGWPPNELDITDLLQDGAAALAIEVLGHRRNSHGPLHHAEKWPQWTGHAQFVTEKDQWVDSYQLVPCGLMKPPRLIVRS
ncbi:MAG TPA: hypothetical protein P5137_13905 [Candidatus Brocadiia bacterium]|nr:hypothetical protein [Candidatus Brocadiia bacterium]